MAQIIDGKAIALKYRAKVKEKVDKILEAGGRAPGLAVILVGEDPASKVYVRHKGIACEKAGFHSAHITLAKDCSEADLIEKIKELNADSKVDGILVQLPLPSHFNQDEILDLIDPSKDVDGFHPQNVGKLVIGRETFVPCTPLGIMKLLESVDVDMKGKEVVILGRSNIVGKPMALLALQKKPGANGTVTVCHSGTANLKEVTLRADILIAAIGLAKFVKKDMVKSGAVVIDVGINRQDDGKLCGDVDFNEVEPLASAITPVPGGVGPMTIAMLLHNTLESYQKRMNDA